MVKFFFLQCINRHDFDITISSSIIWISHFIFDTCKQVIWQTVRTQMKCCMMWHFIRVCPVQTGWKAFVAVKNSTQLMDFSKCQFFKLCCMLLKWKTYGPQRDKTCLRGFWKSEAGTSPLSYTDYLEIWNFACSKPRYDTIKKVNNKGADQTARMRRLVCACVNRKPPKTGFLALRPI